MDGTQQESGTVDAIMLTDTTTLQTLFAGSRDFVALTDAQGRLRYTNHPAAISPDGHPSSTLFDLVLPASHEALQKMQRQVLESGQAVQLEVLARGGADDGEQAVWLLLTINPVSTQGQVTALLHVGIDITARRQEEERLRHIEALMLDTEGIAHYGIWEWDITQPHATWSVGLYKIYGLTPETYVPSYEEYLKKVHDDDRQRVMDATNAVFHQHQPYSHDERILHSDGSIRYLHTWAVPILDNDGKLLRLMGVCLDITDRKLAENALAEHAAELHTLNQELEQRVSTRTHELSLAKNAAEAANASKSRFLAAMSHEVRTPMNGVLGMLELLLEDKLSVEHRRMLGTIRDSAQSLLSILDDILDFSKIEAERLELEEIPVSLRQVVEGVADTLAANAQRKQLHLHCFVDPALPWVLGDAGRLRQILLNLGSNAIKFTETTTEQVGEIHVAARCLEADTRNISLLLSVSDNGMGMDAATQQRLFTPFTQADSSTTRRFGGSGLGLSICKRITELMGGDIRVESAPDQGSTFTVQLRLPVASGPSEIDPTLLQGLRVMALIHTGETQRTLTAYINAAGAQLDCYGNLPAFNAAVATTDPLQPLVLLIGPEHPDSVVKGWLPKLRQASVRPDLGLVLLTPREEGKLPPPQGIVRIWAWPLQLNELLTGLAIASGLLQPEALPLHPEAAAVSVQPLENQLILVAEDNAINQEITQRQLEHLGYRCLLADNGRIALEQWRRRPFGLLLTDCLMPEMDGFELTQAIRAEELASGRHMPIVALTANALRGEAERCLAAGMDDYLSKPLRLANLQKMLERWLGKPGQQL